MAENEHGRDPEESAAEPNDVHDYTTIFADLGVQPGGCLNFWSKEDKASATFSAEEQANATAWVEAHGEYDCYVTPNSVGSIGHRKARNEDVVARQWFVVDFDPVTDPDEDEEDQFPEWESDRLWKDVNGRGLRIFSGRGYQVWLRVEEDVDRRRLSSYLCENYDRVDRGVGVDPVRLGRLPGTMNSKTGEWAEVLELARPGAISAAEVEQLHPDYGCQEVEAEGWDPSEPTPADLDAMPPGARRLWEGQHSWSDRSTPQWAFLVELLKAGLPPDQCCRLWFNMPGGKAEDRGEAYWRSNYASAVQEVADKQSETAAHEARFSALAALIADPDGDRRQKAMALYEPENLTAVRHVRSIDRMRFEGLRFDVKHGRYVKLEDWEKTLGQLERQGAGAEPTGPPDHLLRWLVDPKGEPQSWLHMAPDPPTRLGQQQATVVLRSEFGANSVDSRMAAALASPWVIAFEPFAPRELPGRRWNLSRAQFRVEPAPGEHPHWDLVYNVCGRGADAAVRRDSWCQRHGIQTGADYLRLAFAVMVQDPSRRTPWIFLYSRAQNSGKTTLGVAWRKHMLKGGVVNADRALSNERGFNAELEGNVLALIEETNITKQGRKASYNRLKDWVTADVISIEGKGGNAYEVPNTLHFLQTANDPRNVAFESGDTRITAIELEPMAEEERIDAEELHKRLSEEAPAFLHTLLNLEIPSMGDGRMCPPALTTDLKESQARAAKTAHDLFGERHPEWVGMGDDAFYDAFMAALPEHEERHYWSRSRVLGEIDTLPPKQRELRAVALKLLEVDPGTHSATEWAELIGWDRDPRALGRRLAGLSEVLDGVSGGKSDGARRWTIQHDGGRFAPKRQGGSG